MGSEILALIAALTFGGGLGVGWAFGRRRDRVVLDGIERLLSERTPAAVLMESDAVPAPRAAPAPWAAPTPRVAPPPARTPRLNRFGEFVD